MSMKTVNVTELKAHLSKYLRMASRGARILVNDRDEPLAEIGPVSKEVLPWRERLARAGRLRTGTQACAKLKISSLDRAVDIQSSLRAVREDPNEVRRHSRSPSSPVPQIWIIRPPPDRGSGCFL